MADNDCAITEAPETPSEDPHATDDTTPPRAHCNLEAASIDDDTKEKLKGDRIGDTVLSQSFVIKTLMKFNDMQEFEQQWGEELDMDLCYLWDMTVEEDVCKFLFELNFPSIACTVLQAEVSHRLVEILTGIFGNICTPDSSPILEESHIKVVLHHINTDDHLILVQLMRFVKVIAHKVEGVEFIHDEVMEKIIFILYNSINVSLLETSLDAVDKLTSDKKLPLKYLHENLLEACFIAFKVIYDSENDSDTTDPYKTDVVKRNLMHLLQVLVNLGAYCNEFETAETEAIRRKVDEHKDVLFSELQDILKSYVDEYDITEHVIFVFESIDFIFTVFRLKCDRLIIALIRMANIINEETCCSKVLDSYIVVCTEFFSRLNVDDEFQELLREECSNEEEKEKLVKALGVLQELEVENVEYDYYGKLSNIAKVCSEVASGE